MSLPDTPEYIVADKIAIPMTDHPPARINFVLLRHQFRAGFNFRKKRSS
jgi:hypothetical protein